MRSSLIIKVKFDGTTLVPVSNVDKLNFELFMKNFKIDSEFTMMLSVEGESKTKPQLAKVHKMIRELAEFSGMNFEDVKLLVKNEAALFTFDGENTVIKSFTDCSKKELDAAIKALEAFGAKIGCVFTM